MKMVVLQGAVWKYIVLQLLNFSGLSQLNENKASVALLPLFMHRLLLNISFLCFLFSSAAAAAADAFRLQCGKKSARLKSSNNVGRERLKCLNKTLCLMGRQAGKGEGGAGGSIEPHGLWLLRCDFYTSAGAGWVYHQEQVLRKNLCPSQIQPRKLQAGLAGNEVCIDRPTVDSYFCLPTVKLFQSLRWRFWCRSIKA